MNKIIVFLIIIGTNIFALDINSALSKALENNFSLKEQQYIVEQNQQSLKGAYSQYLPKADLNYIYNDRDELITGQIDKDSMITAVLSYNLFNGLSDMYSINSYKNILQASKHSLKAAKHDLILAVQIAYTDILLAQKRTQTMLEAYNLFTKQYKDAQNFFDQGLIAKNDLLEVEVQMLQAKQNLQKASSSEKIAKQQLENIIGTKIQSDLKELENVVNIDRYLELQVQNRSEVKSLKETLQSLKNQQKTTQGNFYPNVDAQFSYNKFGDDMGVNGRAGYPDSQNVGTIQMSWNLFNGGKDSSDKMVLQKRYKQIAMSLEDLKQQITLQYQTALEEYKLAKLNLDTASKSLEAAKINYEIVSNKYKEGLSTNKDLIDANYLFKNAKENYFSSFYNKYISLVSIKRILEKE